MEPFVSIIVPVYNAENALPRCLDSILAQDYTHFELLLMDDGSKDASPSICDRYAEKDARIRVVHKPNSGVSDTRNQALDLASGDYIQFLDSDDWITPDATRLFVRSAQEHHCDLVIADFYRVVGDSLSHKGAIEKEGLLTREEFAGYMMENPADFYYGVLWNKFFRRDIIEKFHLRMDPDISWCEDFLFNLEYLRHCRTVCALQAPVYYYVKTKGSLVSQNWSISNTIKMKLNVFDYYNQFFKEVYDEEDYETLKPQVYRFFLAAARDNFIPPAPLPGSRKLGQEHLTVSAGVVAAEGIYADLYRYRKLLEYYCETIARKNGLTREEVSLLLILSQPGQISDLKELSDLSTLPRTALTLALQKLDRKEYLRKDFLLKADSPIELLPAAEGILEDLSLAQADFDATRFGGFTDEEKIEYARLSEKIQKNIQDRLEKLS
jgi:glycosyltransferase involved in cell wall biosynthesis